MHYNDLIYCAAGKIIHALQEEGVEKGFMRTHATAKINEDVSYNSHLQPKAQNSMNASTTIAVGYYSGLHIRRGDLQYKLRLSLFDLYSKLTIVSNSTALQRG